MGDNLIMSLKERKRKIILEDVKNGRLSLKDAASRMEVSYRQAKRLKKRYFEKGDQGLVHRSRGKGSGRSYNQKIKEKIIKLYREKYLTYGPTFAAEKLEEFNGIKVNHETLRLWLLKEQLWLRHRERKGYRQRRERRLRFGELLQIDGSIHAWFWNNVRKYCLLNIVDDATGITLSELDTGETSKVLLSVLKKWIEKYGVPLAVYVDLKSLYVSKHCSMQEIEQGYHVFEKVCYKLNIKIIKAYSPQAKGRVERNHGVYQDRFVKELKLRDIKTLEAANKFLGEEYLEKINKKFAKEPAAKENAHCNKAAYGDLDQILCWEERRVVKNDWTISFNNEHYQLLKEQAAQVQRKQEVLVRRHLNGEIDLWQKGLKLNFTRLVEKPVVRSALKIGIDPFKRSRDARRNKHKTPWSKFNPSWLTSCRTS